MSAREMHFEHAPGRKAPSPTSQWGVPVFIQRLREITVRPVLCVHISSSSLSFLAADVIAPTSIVSAPTCTSNVEVSTIAAVSSDLLLTISQDVLVL